MNVVSLYIIENAWFLKWRSPLRPEAPALRSRAALGYLLSYLELSLNAQKHRMAAAIKPPHDIQKGAGHVPIWTGIWKRTRMRWRTATKQKIMPEITKYPFPVITHLLQQSEKDNQQSEIYARLTTGVVVYSVWCSRLRCKLSDATLADGKEPALDLRSMDRSRDRVIVLS